MSTLTKDQAQRLLDNLLCDAEPKELSPSQKLITTDKLDRSEGCMGTKNAVWTTPAVSKLIQALNS